MTATAPPTDTCMPSHTIAALAPLNHPHAPRRKIMDRLYDLQPAGVSIWLDTLSRELLDTGEFARLVDRCHVAGATSNPTLFAKAITSSDRYLPQLRSLIDTCEPNTRELFFALALGDVRRAADILMPVYARTGGQDGFVSACHSRSAPTRVQRPRHVGDGA
jgi:Transaldolase/Fructose-6-phosphate aldolase